jgi:hypothetical protein
MQPVQAALWLRQPQLQEGGGNIAHSRAQAQPARFVKALMQW